MNAVQVEVWVMVDESGEYEVSKDATELQGEAGKASRLVKVTLTVPTPRPVELAAVIAAEPEAGELRGE